MGFDYIAIDPKGKEKKGSMDGADEEKVRAALKEQGFIPLSITKQTILTKEISLGLGKAVKPRELAVFCRQFNSILAAGVTVISALHMLGEQTENKKLKNAIEEVRVGVEKGETLAEAMGEQPHIFPAILVNMVEAGEASGSLDVSFLRMALQFEKDAKLNAMVQKAMIYPIVVCVVAIVVVILMMAFVIPNYVAMFEDIGSELPWITVFVINVSNFVRSKWWLMLLVAAAAGTGFAFFRKTQGGKLFLGQLGLKLPLFGTLTVKTISAKLSRTLSTLLTSGLSLMSAVEIVAKITTNEVVKRCLFDAREEIGRGVPLSQPLEASGLFPPMVYHMTRIGEETGSMENMLDKIADYYEEEVETATAALTAALEPMVIVVLGVIVGTIVMAIMMPMLSLYGGIENA